MPQCGASCVPGSEEEGDLGWIVASATADAPFGALLVGDHPRTVRAGGLVRARRRHGERFLARVRAASGTGLPAQLPVARPRRRCSSLSAATRAWRNNPADGEGPARAKGGCMAVGQAWERTVRTFELLGPP